MTPAEQLRQQQLARQQAGQDIADIEFLAKCEPFQRFWMRSLNLKHATVEESFKYDVLTPDQREGKRQQMLAFEELIKMPGVVRAVCQRTLDQPLPVPGQRPMQAN